MTIQQQSGPDTVQGLTKSQARQLKEIIEMVAEEAGIPARCIYGPDQDQFAVAFRRAMWWCLRDGYLMTYDNIARVFTSSNGGQFNHSSVMTGIQKVREEGTLVFSEQKGNWVARETGASCSDTRLRQALQIVAQVWNKFNPQNQLQSWKNSL